ncbi:unnamed protein product [Durusdinium trenchii]|uniref:peptidylprolyl isomerase n=1 Tax=Durusdinium trenchii TaxID=1381693 RepID=A0ABP0L5V9_9DINO
MMDEEMPDAMEDDYDEEMGDDEPDELPEGITKEILTAAPESEWRMPKKGDDVKVHYVGTLQTDGSKFDSSRDRGQPFEFNLGSGQVIRGWDLGVKTMKKGEVAKFTLAPDFAYGEEGSPPKIPPKATLVFEVELLGWVSKDDLFGDEGAIKTQLKEGSGWRTPNDGKEVLLSLKAKAPDDTVVEEKSQIEYVLSSDALGELGKVVDKVLLNMKKDEEVAVKCTKDYFLGDKYPEGGTVEVTLHEMYDVKDVSFAKDKLLAVHNKGMAMGCLMLLVSFHCASLTLISKVCPTVCPSRASQPLLGTGSWAPVKSPVVGRSDMVVASSCGRNTNLRSTMKKQIKEGEGYESPKDGCKVTLKVEVAGASKTLEFTAGNGEVCDALEGAVLEMKQGERAVLTCTRASSCTEPQLGLTPDGETIMTLELVEFEKQKDQWEISEEEKVQRGQERKDVGSNLFKQGRIELALERYKKVMDLFNYIDNFKEENKTKAKELKKLCDLNKAACHLKLKQHQDAKRCCNNVLKEEGEHLKALFRRAQAAFGLYEYSDCMRDIKRILELDPSNREAKALYKQAQIGQKEEDKKVKGMFTKMCKGLSSPAPAKESKETAPKEDMDE